MSLQRNGFVCDEIVLLYNVSNESPYYMYLITVKPVFINHIKQDICLLFRQVVAYCCMKVVQKALLRYFRSAMSNHLSIVISMSTEWMVA